MTNLLILKMRFYQHKELLKVFAINRNTRHFDSSRNSMYLFLVLPSLVVLGFNLISPFSVFRQVGVYSAFGSSIACFVFSIKDELHVVA